MEMLGSKNGDVVEMLATTSPFRFMWISYSIFIFFIYFLIRMEMMEMLGSIPENDRQIFYRFLTGSFFGVIFGVELVQHLHHLHHLHSLRLHDTKTGRDAKNISTTSTPNISITQKNLPDPHETRFFSPSANKIDWLPAPRQNL